MYCKELFIDLAHKQKEAGVGVGDGILGKAVNGAMKRIILSLPPRFFIQIYPVSPVLFPQHSSLLS